MESAAIDEPLLTVRDIAKRYDVTPQTVYAWNARGTGPEFIRAGLKLRYKLSAVLAWERTRTAGGDAA